MEAAKTHGTRTQEQAHGHDRYRRWDYLLHAAASCPCGMRPRTRMSFAHEVDASLPPEEDRKSIHFDPRDREHVFPSRPRFA